ncbi:hypothetical protein [Actinomycetospora cinnamomea]|uniref:hypothetical protein n=1 Tax=Actinomycetospora cinnamomea TaxID=663609 RepID=UPI0010582151|nr:hypothetical protein [Actinomycetospora cinnamomea]
MHVVDDDEASGAVPAQSATRLAQEGGGVGDRGLDVAQQIAERAEGDVAGHAARHDVGRTPASGVGPVGDRRDSRAEEPGPADPARPADDDRGQTLVAGRGDDGRDRVGPPDQRPALEHQPPPSTHGASVTAPFVDQGRSLTKGE